VIFRKYKECDRENVYRILQSEGVEHDKMFFSDDTTYVLCDYDIIGMFSYHIDNGEPHIIHLCVNKKHRSPFIARLLMKCFKGVIGDEGYTRAIIHVRKDRREYLDKIVRYYTKNLPYSSDNDYNYYILEV